jgi:hypothetical protein
MVILETLGEGHDRQTSSRFFANLKEKAQNLAENIGNTVEAAADKVLGEENVDRIKDVMNTDVGEIASDAGSAIKEKTEDLLEGAEQLADRVLGEERVDNVKSFLQQDVKEVAGDLKEKAESLFNKKEEEKKEE